MERIRHLSDNSLCYTTGAYVRWIGGRWVLERINEDTYFNGKLVELASDDSPIEDSTGKKHYKPFINFSD